MSGFAVQFVPSYTVLFMNWNVGLKTGSDLVYTFWGKKNKQLIG